LFIWNKFRNLVIACVKNPNRAASV